MLTPAEWRAVFQDGRRVVVRHRIPGGMTDAVGVVIALDGDGCVIDTRRGPVEIAWSAVAAAHRIEGRFAHRAPERPARTDPASERPVRTDPASERPVRTDPGPAPEEP